MARTPAQYAKNHPYAILFYTLLLTIGTTPLLRMLGLPDWPIDLLLALALLEAIIAVASRPFRNLLLVVVGLAVVVRLAGRLLGWGLVFEETSTAVWTFTALLAAVGALRAVFRPAAGRGEPLYAALSAYLLVGLFLGIFYWAIAARSPEAILVMGEPASAGNFTQGIAIYFSFVTLATLGYGDIVPATEATRALVILEAVGGQFYLAVLVARLVGVGGPPPRS
jgi:hypothetical protein